MEEREERKKLHYSLSRRQLLNGKLFICLCWVSKGAVHALDKKSCLFFFFSLLDVASYQVSMIWGPTPKPIKVNRRTLN